MNDDDDRVRQAPAGAADNACAVCGAKTSYRLVVGDGFVPLCFSGYCRQEWPRVDALMRGWRDAEDKLKAVRRLLEDHGCDCDCDCNYCEHTDACERCFACRVQGAIE